MSQTASTGADPYVLASLAVYLLILVGISLAALRGYTDTLDGYFLGDRRMKDYVVALSAVVSGRSAWLIVGVSGMAYAQGLSAVWAVPGYILAELWMFFFLAGRLRRFTGMKGDLTLPDFFESRFADSTRILRIAAVAIVAIFMIAYVSAQFSAGGKALGASFGLGYETALWITAAIVLTYTLIGGYFAVAWTDVVQAVLMLLALVILPVKAVADYGGIGPLVRDLAALDPGLLDPWGAGIAAVVGFLAIGLGSPGNPHILVCYMSVDRPSRLRRAAVIGTLWNVLMAWGALYAGLVGRAFFPETGMLPGADTENLFPLLGQTHLHPFLFGLVIAAILMAIMSTADSQLLVFTSALTRDLYQKLSRRGAAATQRVLVLLSRAAVVVGVLLAGALAVTAEELVFWLVLFAWAGLGAAFGPAMVLSLFWARTTRAGVLAGFGVGTGVVFVWRLVEPLRGLIYELVPGFLAAMTAIVVVSLLTRPPPSADDDLRAITPRYRPRERGGPDSTGSP